MNDFDNTCSQVTEYLSKGTLQEQYLKTLKLAGVTPARVDEDVVYQWALAEGIIYSALMPVLHPPKPIFSRRQIDDDWEASDWEINAQL
jgi:hypothetical protein